MEKFPQQNFKTPAEETAFLRSTLEKTHENESEPKEAILNKYHQTPADNLLPADRIINERHAKMLALNLTPETHDGKIAELLKIVEERGIKNALVVASKLNDPHLFDDFHRAIIAYLAVGNADEHLKEKDPLWHPLHMSLFEIRLPNTNTDNRGKKLSELISGMEQFYSAMVSVAEPGKSSSWFTIEIANENGQSDFVFYVSIFAGHGRLLEKQVASIFPGAVVTEKKDDYNIFNENGKSVGAYAVLEKPALYPLNSYNDFDIDPLEIILSGFTKIDRDGEGAAIQLVVGPRQDDYANTAQDAVRKIREGEKVETALANIERSQVSKVVGGVLGSFRSSKDLEREKLAKADRAANVDNSELEQFEHKLQSPLVMVSLRVVASSNTEPEAEAILNDIMAGFSQFENTSGNRLNWHKTRGHKQMELLQDFSLRNWNSRDVMILNLEELTTIIHLPTSLSSSSIHGLRQTAGAAAPAPTDLPNTGSLLGINDFRGQEIPVRITDEDRLRHFYIIGQTGTGKTTLMKNMLLQDISAGHGICFIDPHGSDVVDILASIPENRQADVIYFDPARQDRVMGLNMLEFDPAYPEQKTFVINELFSIFQKLYGSNPESMGPMFEQYFRNATALVLEDTTTGSTLLDISRVFADANYRRAKLAKARNPVVVQFWNEIATKAGGEAALENIVPYITSKFDVFTANDFMRPIVGQQHSAFNFRNLMDEKKILLVNLSKGRLGEINSNLIGMIIVGKILMAALSRVDDLTGNYPPFYLHMDEFQNITTDSISAILSEARKYKLGLTVAHQFIAQLDQKISDAIFGNVGSMAAFRVGPEDAEFLEKQFAPVFNAKDLMNIENRHAALRLLVNGMPKKPFNIVTLPPPQKDLTQVQVLADASYAKYAQPRRKVEMEISSRYLS